LIRECLEKTPATTPWLSRRSIAVRNTPLVSERILRGEDDLHVGGPAKVEVVGNQRLEEPAGVAWRVEHQGAGDLDLPHRALPPVAAIPIRLAQRQRQTSKPALHEDVDGGWPEPVADRLEHGRVGAGPKPVGQLRDGQPGLGGLAFGPLVTVDPDLDRVGEVGADLDERRAEVGVPQGAGSSSSPAGRPW
jgi:hypothetical protein